MVAADIQPERVTDVVARDATTGGVSVGIFREELAEAYDQYLLANPRSLFYASSKYRRFLTTLLQCEDRTLVAVAGNTIRGVLPLMSRAGSRGNVYNSLPYYGSNGGVLADDAEVSGALVHAYNTIAASPDTLASTAIDHPFMPQGPTGLRFTHVDHRIGQYTRIDRESSNEQEILARIDSSARRNVKKAQREGVAVEVDHSQLDRLRQLHQDNMRAIGGLAKSDAFFALLPVHFNPGHDYDVYVARRDGLVIAALLLFYFNQTVEYFTPAIDGDHRSIQPLSLILYTALTEASRRGFTWWNWGGTWTSQSGVYRFKAKWGASESMYSYYTQLNDEAILDWAPADILSAYPNFFVVPFTALERGGGVDE
jgi:hypothetical protein